MPDCAGVFLVDAAPVRAHLLKLQAIGWTLNAVAAANGSPGKLVSSLRRIVDGQQYCAPSTRDMVMWMDPELPPETGTLFVRRWTEYQFIGVADHEAARRMGITYSSMETLMTRHRFRRSQLLIDLASEERAKAKAVA